MKHTHTHTHTHSYRVHVGLFTHNNLVLSAVDIIHVTHNTWVEPSQSVCLCCNKIWSRTGRPLT